MEEITATVEEIVYRNEDNGYTVVEISVDKDLHTAVGVLAGLRDGERVVLTGEWTSHPTYGQQFKVAMCRSLPPDTREGLIRYLSSGIVQGVGPVLAERIVEELGQDALRIIREEPHRLSDVSGIGSVKAITIAQAIAAQVEMQESMVFLQSLHISLGLATRIYRKYGGQCVDIIQNDTYRLVADVEGIGFRTADQIARTMGITQDTPSRIIAGILYLLQEAAMQQGHTCLPQDELLRLSTELLGPTSGQLERGLTSLLVQRSVVLRRMEDKNYFFLPWFHSAEMEVAKRLIILSSASTTQLYADMNEAVEQVASLQGIILSLEQQDAVRSVLEGGITVITGGPGTGKTTTINCLIGALEQVGCTVALAAPTGRAAKRMTETTGREAKTIHRLLEYAFEGDDEEGSFQRDESNPLECNALVVDEMSMVDILLMQHLLRAVPLTCRLILVGDADQLPSVGPGNVLRDIIVSGVARVERLTAIFRQGEESRIVLNAHRVNHGEMPDLNSRNGDFFFERHGDTASALSALEAMVSRRLPGYLDCDALRDIQVLTPMKKGDLGVHHLNKQLQQLFNPPHPLKRESAMGDLVYREGDKVMQIKNNYRLPWRRCTPLSDEEGKGVFNGDLGFIQAIDPEDRLMHIVFDDGREADYEFIMAHELTLAYAISVHKSQGSEFPVVVMPLVSGPPMLMTRNLLYTAITRARRMVVLVGRESCIKSMVENNRIIQRYSGLPHAFITAGGFEDAFPS